MIPTKPGWYWWREAAPRPYERIWQIVQLQDWSGELCQLWPLTGGRTFLPNIGGEFGPHIPVPPTEPPGLGLVHDTGEANVPLEWALVWVAVRAQPPKEDAP